MKKFIINVAGISVMLILIGWLVFSLLIPQYYLPVFPFLLLFFAVSSVLIYGYQLKLAKKDFSKFTRSNMLITFFKLFLYSSVAIVYIALDTKNAKVFVVCFVILYLIFTVFEVFSLIRITSNDKAKN